MVTTSRHDNMIVDRDADVTTSHYNLSYHWGKSWFLNRSNMRAEGRTCITIFGDGKKLLIRKTKFKLDLKFLYLNKFSSGKLSVLFLSTATALTLQLNTFATFDIISSLLSSSSLSTKATRFLLSVERCLSVCFKALTTTAL